MQYRIGHLTLHPGRQLCDDGQRVTLGRKALEILSFLAEHGGEVVSKEEILDAVWPGLTVEENVIQVHVAAIRRALGGAAQNLATVHGIGYQLWVDEEGSAADPTGRLKVAQPTIAVLSFESGGDDDSWFAEGIAEEILLQVSRIGGVATLARGSSFQLKGEARAAASIARELGATHVLDGSARRQNGRVRIIAQLVSAPQGKVLWSDSFDGTGDDVFAMQDAVAAATASALEREICGREARPSITPQAYDVFLKARSHAGNLDVLDECIAGFREVTKVAPDYPDGWASLALNLALAARWDVEGASYEAVAAEAREAAARALELADAPNAHIALGVLQPIAAYKEREAYLAAARRSRKPDAQVTRQLGEFAYEVGRMTEAFAWFEQSVRLDPLNPATMDAYAVSLLHLGREEEGQAAYAYARQKWPDIWWMMVGPLTDAAFAGNWEVVDALLAEPMPNPEKMRPILWTVESLRDPSEKASIALIDLCHKQMEETGRVDPSLLVHLATLGRMEEVGTFVEELEYAYRFRPDGRARDGIGFHEGIVFSRAGKPLRASEKFPLLCAKLGLARYWVESDRWPDCAEELGDSFHEGCRQAVA